jgi:glycolate oxidase FAD binding subunit
MTVPSTPESVIRPASTEEVAELMAWASRDGVGVLPRGAAPDGAGPATDLQRASGVPEGRYVVVSSERLTGIDIYEPADLTITAGAGTSVRDIDGVLRAQEQWAPFDAPFMSERTLGGLVASGESGPLWAGYGELRNHVLGMTVVTGDGRTLRLGGRVVKNVAGFDLLKAMVGSRGSLAMITSVCLRAFPVPEVDRVLVLPGERLADLVPLAQKAVAAPVLPVSTVLVDHVPGLDGQSALVVRLHGARSTVDADQACLERHLGVALMSLGDRGGDHAEVRQVVQDRGADAPTYLVASSLPSRLPVLVEALEALEPVSLVVDCYSGRARLGAVSLSTDAVTQALDTVERVGGALRVERWPIDRLPSPNSTTPSPDELDLTRALEETFDPMGVLWPSRL